MSKITAGSLLGEVTTHIKSGATGREWNPGDRIGPNDLPTNLFDKYLTDGTIKRLRLKRKSQPEGQSND